MPECPYCSNDIKQEYFDEGKFCPFCGNRLPGGEEQQTFIGRKIGGHYIIEEKLGEGGMGYVFKAKHTMLDKDVAIKVLREDFADNPEAFERFRREARNTSQLSHPNAVTMYDFGQTDDGLVYIILEYIDGLDLKAIITREGPIPEERAIIIFIQICDVLEEAHEQNIIHRDLKSENIMLCRKSKQKDFVKVLDFGIAKLMDVGGKTSGGTLTQKGVVFGTPQYMCPEQVKGEKMDQRSDIYSLAVIMYEVLTGNLPFNTSNPVDIMVMQVKKKAPPLRKSSDLKISSNIEKIIHKCLEKKPENRFQSARELREALSTIASNFITSISSKMPAIADDKIKEKIKGDSLDISTGVKKVPGFKLINVDGLGADATGVFTKTPVKIGRHSSNDIIVRQPRVSKFHAEIHFKDNKYVLVDKGSLNGSYVNGKHVKARVLEDEDLVELSKRQGLKARFAIVNPDN